LVRHHPHDFVAAHFRLERAADAAIGAGSERRPFGLAFFDDLLFEQRAGRTRLHAGAAGHTLRFHELLVHAGGNDRVEAATGHGQRESALHLFAGAHAARADDALGWIEGEIGIGVVDAGIAVAGAVKTVTYFFQADRLRGLEQFDVWVFGAIERIHRMIGDIELHDSFAQAIEPVALGPHYHAFGHRRRARRRRAGTAFDLDQAQPA